MKYLVAILSLVAGVAFAADFGTSHDIILFGSVDIPAGQTNVHETVSRLTGIAKQSIVYSSGDGMTTTTVQAVQGDLVRPIATVAIKDGIQKSATGFEYLYFENLRYTTVNYGTNDVSVIVGTVYEK